MASKWFWWIFVMVKFPPPLQMANWPTQAWLELGETDWPKGPRAFWALAFLLVVSNCSMTSQYPWFHTSEENEIELCYETSSSNSWNLHGLHRTGQHFLGDLNHTLYNVWWWKITCRHQEAKCVNVSLKVFYLFDFSHVWFFHSLLGCSWCTKCQKNKFLLLRIFTGKKPIWLTWWNLGMAV